MSAKVDVLAVFDAYSDVEGTGITQAQHDAARAAVAAALSALAECETYLEDREDVIDGDYGIPAPNREMTLLREVRAALVLCGAASPETARICATSGP